MASPEDEFGFIDEFKTSGLIMSEEERRDRAKKEGLCVACLRRTHVKGRWFSMVRLTNEHVYQGLCIQHNKDKVPKEVYETWKQYTWSQLPDSPVRSSKSRKGKNKKQKETSCHLDTAQSSTDFNVCASTTSNVPCHDNAQPLLALEHQPDAEGKERMDTESGAATLSRTGRQVESVVGSSSKCLHVDEHRDNTAKYDNTVAIDQDSTTASKRDQYIEDTITKVNLSLPALGKVTKCSPYHRRHGHHPVAGPTDLNGRLLEDGGEEGKEQLAVSQSMRQLRRDNVSTKDVTSSLPCGQRAFLSAGALPSFSEQSSESKPQPCPQRLHSYTGETDMSMNNSPRSSSSSRNARHTRKSTRTMNQSRFASFAKADSLSDNSDQSISSSQSHAERPILSQNSSSLDNSLSDDSDQSESSGLFVEGSLKHIPGLSVDSDQSQTQSPTSCRSLTQLSSRFSLRDDWRSVHPGHATMELSEVLKCSIEDDNPTELRNALCLIRDDYDKNDHGATIQLLKEVLTLYNQDPQILDVACGVVWRMAADNAEIKRDISDSGLLDLVVDALLENRYDFEFVEWAMGAISCLASDSKCQAHLASKNGIEMILDILDEHRYTARVFEWSCRALCALITGDEDCEESFDIASRNLVQIEEADGVSLIIETMGAHTTEPGAQQMAVDLLWMTIYSSHGTVRCKLIRKLVDADFIQLSRRLLRAQSTTCELFSKVAELLCVILSEYPDQETVVDTVMDCLPSIVRRMRESEQNTDVLKAGVRLFVAIVLLGDVQPHLLEELGASQVLVDALMSLKSDASSMKSGLLLLWKISSYGAELLDHTLVLSSLDIVEAAFSLDTFSLNEYSCAFGFVVNALQTPGLVLADLPLDTFLDFSFEDEESRQEARIVASKAMPPICLRFPDFGHRAVKYMTCDPVFQGADKCNLEKLLNFVETVANTGGKLEVDSPRGVLKCLVGALPEVNDPKMLETFAKCLLLLLHLSTNLDDVPLGLEEALVRVLGLHPHERTVRLHVLDAMTHIYLLSDPIIRPEETVDAILDSALLASSDDDTQEKATRTLWALLAKGTCRDPNTLFRLYSFILHALGRFAGDEAEAFDSTLIETSCGLLSAVASLMVDSPLAISKEELRIIFTIFSMSLNREDSLGIPSLILETLHSFCFVDRTLLVDSGVMLILAEAIDEKFVSDFVQIDVGFALLSQLVLSEDDSITLGILEWEGIESLLRGMKEHNGHLGIQINGCKALSHLSTHDEARHRICEQGGINLIVSTLETHGDDTRLIECGCSALLNMTSMTSDVPDWLIEQSGIVERTIDLLLTYQKSLCIERDCIGILQNISRNRSKVKAAIGDLGGIDAVLQAFSLYLDSPVVIERAFATLWSLAILDENKRRILQSDQIDTAIMAMMHLVVFDGVQSKACGFIRTLSLDKLVGEAIAKSDGCDAVALAMLAHFDNKDIQVDATQALSCLYYSLKDRDGVVPSDEEIGAIIMAMRRFPLDENVQLEACGALLAILTSCHFNLGPFIKEVQDLMELASQYDSCAVSAVQILSLLSQENKKETLNAENDGGLNHIDDPELAQSELYMDKVDRNTENAVESPRKLVKSNSAKSPCSETLKLCDTWALIQFTEESSEPSGEIQVMPSEEECPV